MYPRPDWDASRCAPEAAQAAGRLCLLKGCGRRFYPRPQDISRAKYCSEACRKKARKWRRWLRRKLRAREAPPEEPQGKRWRRQYQRIYRARNGDRVRQIERESKRRRRSTGGPVHKGPRCPIPCHRPGCYEEFEVPPALETYRKYCGSPCRLAMRRFQRLLGQLRYRQSPGGCYKRKLSRRPKSPSPAGGMRPGGSSCLDGGACEQFHRRPTGNGPGEAQDGKHRSARDPGTGAGPRDPP